MWILKCDVCGCITNDSRRRIVIKKPLGKFENNVDLCPKCYELIRGLVRSEIEREMEYELTTAHDAGYKEGLQAKAMEIAEELADMLVVEHKRVSEAN